MSKDDKSYREYLIIFRLATFASRAQGLEMFLRYFERKADGEVRLQSWLSTFGDDVNVKSDVCWTTSDASLVAAS